MLLSVTETAPARVVVIRVTLRLLQPLRYCASPNACGRRSSI